MLCHWLSLFFLKTICSISLSFLLHF